MRRNIRKSILIAGLLLVFISFVAAIRQINSGVYDWSKLKVIRTHSGTQRRILKGPTRSLEMFEINALSMHSGKMTHSYLIGKQCDELIIIKEGSAEISINSQKEILGAGSIAVASEGDRLIIKNPGSSDLVYYALSFKPHPSKNHPVATKKVAGFFSAWDTVTFVPTANGGRRNLIQRPLSSLRQLEIHTTTLKEGLPSHAAHSHPDEEIILVKSGTVEETIMDVKYRLGPGSVIFATNDDMHGIGNAGAGPCEYYAIRWLVY
jgi:(S)-ureidoglycine aminohydrolase